MIMILFLSYINSWLTVVSPALVAWDYKAKNGLSEIIGQAILFDKLYR